MSEERFQELQRIFDAAVEIPPPQREQWLREQCSEDSELLRQVQRLLDHDQNESAFLEGKAAELLKRELQHVDSETGDPSPIAAESAPSMQEFLSALIETGLLKEAEAETIRARYASEDSATLAERLVADRRLTEFQAKSLLGSSRQPIKLGKYLILDELGAGGMGQVYLAEHRRMKRKVALKVLPQEMMADHHAVDRFQREIEAVARLSHENIVTAFDADEANDVHFFVMEYVEGSDLAKVVKKQGPLSAELAMAYIRQAAAGLSYLHGQGMVHRDVKPSNLMVEPTGRVSLLDVGLAKVRYRSGQSTTAMELTSTGHVIGTIDFMAPEQARDTRGADHRADMYSLGCTFYFLLTGRPLYERKSAIERLRAHKDEPIPQLSDIDSNLPAEFDLLLRSMVAKRREDRFQSMDELIECVDRLIVNPSEATKKRSSVSSLSTDSGVSSRVAISPAKPIYRRPAVLLGLSLVAAIAVGYVALNWEDTSQREGDSQLAADVTGAGQSITVDADLDTDPLSDTDAGSSTTSPDTAASPELQLGRWVVGRGGEMTVRTGGAEQQIKDVSSMPVAPFTITAIALSGEEIQDDDLARLESQGDLESLSLTQTSVSIDRVIALKEQLRSLDIEFDHSDFQADHRQAAEWILSEGGTVRVAVDAAADVDVKSTDDLPSEPFLIKAIYLSHAGVSNADLSRLARLYSVEALDLRHNSIDDVGIENLRKWWRLKNVDLYRTNVTSQAIHHLRHCFDLRRVSVRATKIRDGFWQFAYYFPSLVDLDISSNNTSDAQLAKLAPLSKLKSLKYWDTGITSASIDTFLQFASLETLESSNSAVDGSRLNELASLEHLATFGVNCDHVSPKELEALRNFTALHTLWLGKPSADHFEVVSGLPRINVLLVIGPDKTVNADSIRNLAAIPKLTYLRLGHGWFDRQILEAAVSIPSLKDVNFSGARLSLSDINSLTDQRPGLSVTVNENCIDLDAHLNAARWVLDRDGQLSVRRAGGEVTRVERSDDLPGVLFEVTAVDLSGDQSLKDQDLERLHPINTLETIRLDHTGITGISLGKPGALLSLTASNPPLSDEGLAAICKNRNLQTLSLSSTNFSANAISGLKNLKQLSGLYLHGGTLADAMPEVLASLTRLNTVGLQDGDFDDRSLQVLGKMPTIMQLQLHGSMVTDAGLVHLLPLAKLRMVQLTSTQVTDAGVANLMASMPTCNVLHDSVPRQQLPDYMAAVALLAQSAECKILPFYAPVIDVRGEEDLPELAFVILDVSFLKSDSEDSLDLAPLSGLRALRRVSITSRSVNSIDLALLAPCPTLETLVLRDVVVTGGLAQSIASIRSLRRLEVSANALSAELSQMIRTINPALRVVQLE